MVGMDKLFEPNYAWYTSIWDFLCIEEENQTNHKNLEKRHQHHEQQIVVLQVNKKG